MGLQADPRGRVVTDLTDTYDVTPDAEGWRIDDDHAAQWALRRLKADAAELARVKAVYDDERAILDNWLAGQQARHDGEKLRAHLADYYRRLIDDGHTGPYRLPSGRLSIRTGRLSRRVVDTDAAIAWCQEHAPDALKVGLSVSLLPGCDRDGQIVTDDGEVIPGIEVTRGDDTFVVALTDEADDYITGAGS